MCFEGIYIAKSYIKCVSMYTEIEYFSTRYLCLARLESTALGGASSIVNLFFV